MGFRRFSIACSVVAAACAFVPLEPVMAADSAVVLMYHRFGDERYPSTNIRLDELDGHLAELKAGGYHVLPVTEIVAALKDGKPLPERTVGITIDDAYLSVFTNGWPRFKAAGIPVTLFVATDPVDEASAGHSTEYMTWDQVREMAAGGATIGHHSASHLHMAATDIAKNRRDLERATARFVEKLGQRPALFAYPYGESSLATERLAADMGFAVAFGQHSGAIGKGANFFYLPRFALNETYGEVKRFRLVAGTLPLAVSDVTPADPLIGVHNPPAIGFTVRDPAAGLDRLSCYISPEKAQLERLGENRFEVRVEKPFAKGRTRLNCTMPAADGRWYWYGRQFYVP